MPLKILPTLMTHEWWLDTTNTGTGTEIHLHPWGGKCRASLVQQGLWSSFTKHGSREGNCQRPQEKLTRTVLITCDKNQDRKFRLTPLHPLTKVLTNESGGQITSLQKAQVVTGDPLTRQFWGTWVTMDLNVFMKTLKPLSTNNLKSKILKPELPEQEGNVQRAGEGVGREWLQTCSTF